MVESSGIFSGSKNNFGLLTDGKRIVYVRTDMWILLAHAYVNYQISNGFIAYTKLDVGKNLQIWLMDSLETNGRWRRLLKIKRSRRQPINTDSPMSIILYVSSRNQKALHRAQLRTSC